MEARMLEERDTKRYIALRMQAASECPGHMTRDIKEELFLLADHSTTEMSRHSRQGAVVWGVYDGHLLAGTLAVARRFNVRIRNHLWLWGCTFAHATGVHLPHAC